MNNLEKLRKAGLLKSDASLTEDQIKAIDLLTSEEIDVLISVKNKIRKVFADKFDFEIGIDPIGGKRRSPRDRRHRPL